MTLTTLRVRDLATIADVTLELGGGLNVLTGETGAGKSMLVDALALLLGDRADRAAIRPGAAKMVIEGVFDALPAAVRAQLEAMGLDADDSFVVRREVTSEGRSRAWINGSPTTMGVLAAIGERLVDLHGQHQTLQLLDPATQRSLLDALGNADAAADAVQSAFADVAAFHAQHEALTAKRDQAQRRADWLRHVVQEIDAAKIKSGEEAALDREAARLSQAGALSELARHVIGALDEEGESARAAFARAERSLNALERLDPAVTPWRELLDGAYAQIDELVRRIAEYTATLTEDPARLAHVETRRDLFYRLKQKHGPALTDVVASRDAAREELDILDTATVDLGALHTRLSAAGETLGRVAGALTEIRERAARQLAREVSRLLPPLGLNGAEFEVRLVPWDAPRADGAEGVEFLVRLNRGMEPRPLAKVASGGELSRLMLALKVALARHDAVPTLVFDEIDQGVGGEVGAKIGTALTRVAERHQVLVITHLPQIAAHADRHVRVAKATRAGVATSDVEVLHGEDRVQELARMLGDADGAAARRLALALLNERVSA